MNFSKYTKDDVEMLARERVKFTHTNGSEAKEIFEGTKEFLLNGLKEDNVDCCLLKMDGEIIGLIMIVYYPTPPSVFNMSGKNAYITNFYIAKEHRRKGYGTELLRYASEVIKERGCQVVHMNYSDSNLKDFYHNFGFEDISDWALILKMD